MDDHLDRVSPAGAAAISASPRARVPFAGVPIPKLRETRLTSAALIASLCGFLTLISVLPSFARVVLLFAFVAMGPGSAIMLTRPFRGLPTAYLVPLLGISVVILMAGGLAFAHLWSPTWSLVELAGLTALLALGHVRPLLEELRG